MEPQNRHPLDSITNSSSLSMLEAMIPFVEYPLKLPLALLIKFNEIRLIINAFRSRETLTRLGLHNAANSPLDMLGSLTGISPEMLKMLFTLSENSGDSFSPDILSALTGKNTMDFSNIASMFQQPGTGPPNDTVPDPAPSFPPFEAENNINPTEENSDDFDLNIQNILAEYDMMQAEQLSKEQSPDVTNQH